MTHATEMAQALQRAQLQIEWLQEELDAGVGGVLDGITKVMAEAEKRNQRLYELAEQLLMIEQHLSEVRAGYPEACIPESVGSLPRLRDKLRGWAAEIHAELQQPNLDAVSSDETISVDNPEGDSSLNGSEAH